MPATAVQTRGLDRHTVTRAERLIAFATERRTGIDQREVDVEENGASHASGVSAGSADGGPATTMAARAGSRSCCAAC